MDEEFFNEVGENMTSFMEDTGQERIHSRINELKKRIEYYTYDENQLKKESINHLTASASALTELQNQLLECMGDVVYLKRQFSHSKCEQVFDSLDAMCNKLKKVEVSVCTAKRNISFLK